MTRGRRATRSAAKALLASVALAVTGVAAGCGGGDDAGGETAGVAVEAGATLVATVGPGFDIALETQDGEAVAAAAPGSYTLEVSDESSIHNFHLTGPGVDEDSGVAEEGSSTWSVTLEPGTYVFVCDPHPSMRGEVEVG